MSHASYSLLLVVGSFAGMLVIIELDRRLGDRVEQLDPGGAHTGASPVEREGETRETPVECRSARTSSCIARRERKKEARLQTTATRPQPNEPPPHRQAAGRVGPVA